MFVNDDMRIHPHVNQCRLVHRWRLLCCVCECVRESGIQKDTHFIDEHIMKQTNGEEEEEIHAPSTTGNLLD